MNAPPEDVLVKQIGNTDGTCRLSIYRRPDGLFLYRDDIYAEFEEVPPFFWDGYPPSGLFASAEAAERDARAAVDWLRQMGRGG
jgi:hypothetical protein